MSKLTVSQAFTTTDGTVFTGPNAAQEASTHQASLDNSAVIESFIKHNKLIKSAAGAARNMLPKFLAYKDAIDSGDLELLAPDAKAEGEDSGETKTEGGDAATTGAEGGQTPE